MYMVWEISENFKNKTLFLWFDSSKLQSDLKTTKVEELRLQAEMFYKEILRLKQDKAPAVDYTPR